jgi:GntR family transcriptional regulator
MAKTSSSRELRPARARISATFAPRYAQLANILGAAIAAGKYDIGTMIPTEHEISAKYEVSRATVREALRRLQDLGLITRVQGVGTLVASHDAGTRYVLKAKSEFEIMGYESQTLLHISERKDVTLTKQEAKILRCASGTKWVRLSGVRMVIGEKLSRPLSAITLYVQPEYRDVTLEKKIEKTPIYRLIEAQHGIHMTEIEQDITAVKLDAGSAKVLKVATGVPALHVVRRFFGSKGKLLEATINIHPADRFTFSLRLHSTETNRSAIPHAD